MPVHAVVVGSLVMDLAFRVPKRPEPGEVVIAQEYGAYRGGKGYNQAVALARLGADRVTMVGAVGADAYGDGFVTALQTEGIDADRVVQLRGVNTALAVPLITPDGDVGFVQHQGANRYLEPAHCADLPSCDVLLLQGEVNARASERAAAVIRGRGGIVMLNPAPVHDITPALLDAATLITPNEVEARALAGDGGGAEGIELARALRTEERVAVVTMGAAGAAFAGTRGAEGTITPPSVAAIDATAAGDSFCAGLCLALAGGAELEDAVRFATAAGAAATTVSGAEPSLPTRTAVNALLSAASPSGQG